MAHPDTILRSIKEAIKTSDRLPTSTTYAVFELDTDGGQANVRPPVVELTTIDMVRSDTMNTDFVRHATDDNGNHIGRIYHVPFQMPVNINVITAEGDGYDPNEIGREIRTALYRYENRQERDCLPDPDTDGDLSDVTLFELNNAEPNNDLAMTPALRGWTQEAEVRFREVIDTSQEYGEDVYVETVDAPKAGEGVAGTNISVVFDVSPNQDSTADDFT